LEEPVLAVALALALAPGSVLRLEPGFADALNASPLGLCVELAEDPTVVGSTLADDEDDT